MMPQQGHKWQLMTSELESYMEIQETTISHRLSLFSPKPSHTLYSEGWASGWSYRNKRLLLRKSGLTGYTCFLLRPLGQLLCSPGCRFCLDRREVVVLNFVKVRCSHAQGVGVWCSRSLTFWNYVNEQRRFCQDWVSFQTLPSQHSRAERVCGMETDPRADAPGPMATYCVSAGRSVPAPLHLYPMPSS